VYQLYRRLTLRQKILRAVASRTTRLLRKRKHLYQLHRRTNQKQKDAKPNSEQDGKVVHDADVAAENTREPENESSGSSLPPPVLGGSTWSFANLK